MTSQPSRGQREHAQIIDALLVAVVAVAGQQEAWFPVAGMSFRSGPTWALAAAYLVTAIALLWRRRAPLAVAAVVTATLTGYGLAFGFPDGLGPLLPVLVAFYSAGRYSGGLRFWAATALVSLDAAVHLLLDPRYHPGPTIGLELLPLFILAAAGAVGQVQRAGKLSVRSLQRRAAQLEADQEVATRAAVEGERDRLARELHDLVGHGLSLVVVQVMAAQASLEAARHDLTAQRLTNIENAARATLAEARRLITISGRPEADFGPQPTLVDLPDLVSAVSDCGIPVELTVDANLPDLPAGLELAVYRIIQESLTNIMKHATSPSGVSVTVSAAGPSLSLDVTDVGIAPPGEIRPGRGITGMRERASLYGGELLVAPADGGVSVRACFPLLRVPA